jgi:molybdenum cofactor synthesis domain-containing protein
VRSVAVLIVGDEILSGEIPDENGPFLIARLAREGVRVERLVVAPDREHDIVSELARLRALADAVVVSGGIGPTHDDVTRPALAHAVGSPLVRHEEAERRIRRFYGERVTEAELSMALVPRGSELLHGPRTGTFGFSVAGVYALPGVPVLFRDLVEGMAGGFTAPPLHRAEIHTQRREGEFARDLADVQGRATDAAIGSYPVFEEGRWHVRVVVRCCDPARLEQVAREVRAIL